MAAVVGWALFLRPDGIEATPKPRTAAKTGGATARQLADLGATNPGEAKPAIRNQSTEQPSPEPARKPKHAETRQLQLQAVDIGGAGHEAARAYLLPEAVSTFAYNEPTGNVIFPSVELPGFVVFNMNRLAQGDLRPVKAIKTKWNPTALLTREWNGKQLFLCATEGRRTVSLLDAETLAPLREVGAGSKHVRPIRNIASSTNLSDPFVYATSRTSRERVWSLRRIDLRTGREVAESLRAGFPTGFNARGDVFAMSPRYAPFQISSWPFSPADCQPTPLAVGRSDTVNGRSQRAFFAPDGQSILLGSQLASPGLTPVGDRLPATVHDQFADKDLLVAVLPPSEQAAPASDGDPFRRSMVLMSSNFEIVTEQRLPRWQVLTRQYSQPESARAISRRRAAAERQLTQVALPRLVADEKRQQVVAFYEDGLYLCPLAGLSRRDGGAPTQLTIEADVPGTVLVGRSVEVPIRVTGGTEPAVVQLVPADASQSYAIPAGDGSRDTDGNPRVEDGVFRWTPQPHHVGRPSVSDRQSKRVTRAIRFKATSGRSTREWTWDIMVEYPSEPIPFVVDGGATNADGTQAVIWGHDDTEAILATYDIRTQALLSEVGWPNDLEIRQAAISRKGVYLVCCEDQSPSHLRLMRLTNALQEERYARVPGFRTRDSSLSADGQYLWVNFKDARNLVFDAENLRALNPVVHRGGELTDAGWLEAGILWDKEFTNPRWLRSPLGFRGVRRSDRSKLLMPIAARPDWRQPGSISVQVGDQIHEVSLVGESAAQAMTSVGFEKILSVVAGRAFVTDTPKRPAAPLMIRPRQSHTELSFSEPTTVSYMADQPAEWSLTVAGIARSESEVPGQFTVDISSGIDWKRLVGMGLSSTMLGDLLDYSDVQAPVYERITGKVPLGVPVAVPATVTATNQNGQVSAVHYYLVDVPISEILPPRK